MVRAQLEADGYQIMSWQSNPQVDPSIWFVGDTQGPEWVVVRAGRAMEGELRRPANWEGIAASCAHLSLGGHFAPVMLESADEASVSGAILRGHRVDVQYEGFVEDR